jgi:four helix bundle protein
LERWNGGALERWNVGVLERWSVGVLERWSVGTLERWNVGTGERWSVAKKEERGMKDTKDRYRDLLNRTKAYASRIIKLYTHIQTEHHFNAAAAVLAKQLLRSGTAVAANHREARHSRSRADRIAKFTIVLQELEESSLWLELFIEHQMAQEEELDQLWRETQQLIAIFIASIQKLRNSGDEPDQR